MQWSKLVVATISIIIFTFDVSSQDIFRNDNESLVLHEPIKPTMTLIDSKKFTFRELLKAFKRESQLLGFQQIMNNYYYLNEGLERRDSAHILDANLSAYYGIFDKSTEIKTKNDTLNRFVDSTEYLFDITFHMHIRLFNQFSNPGRTVSFLPGGRLYKSNRNWTKVNVFERDGLEHTHRILQYSKNSSSQFRESKIHVNSILEHTKETHVTNHIAFASFFHHSNAQDGETLVSKLDSTFANSDNVKIVNENHKLNVYNGSFSTYYLDIGHIFSSLKTYEKEDFEVFDNRWMIQNKLDFHFGIEDDMRDFHSAFNYSFEFKKFYFKKNVETHRIGTRLNIRLDPFLDGLEGNTILNRLDLVGFYSYRIPFSSNVSLFLEGGYIGSDFLNIYLEDKFLFVKWGIATGNFFTTY